MHKYNEKEAILQKWKKMLLNLRGTNKNKKALLDIIDSQKNAELRLLEFNLKKVDILQQETNETENLSFFTWLWSCIVSFFCFWDPQTPSLSGLEELLLIDVIPESFTRLSETSIDSGNIDLLNDANFEEALFTNPAKAVADIRGRINYLPDIRGKINNILERLDAIKYLLTADTYQDLLAKLYKYYPLETLIYHYQSYSEDVERFVGPEEFLELELMSRALMDLFILPLDTDPLSLRCFAIQELLLVLACSHLKNPPLMQVLNGARENKTNITECFRTLSPAYEQAKSTMLELIPGSTEHLKNSTLILGRVVELQNNLAKHFIYQPIFLNFARLACQELLSNYHQFPEQHTNSVLNQTIEFLSSAILGTWSEAKVERKKIVDLMTERKHIIETNFSMSECCAILSIFSHTQSSKFNYQKAVFFANQIIMASLAGQKDLIIKAQEFCNLDPHEEAWVFSVIERLQLSTSLMTEEELVQIATKLSSFKQEQLQWIFKVIEHIQPSGPQLAMKLKSFMAREESEEKEFKLSEKRSVTYLPSAKNPNRFLGNPPVQTPPEALSTKQQTSFQYF
ncbi:MAG: hypothetical protein H0U57_01975 [Tatlockia sp.]|nr:hypothetical protein [Tatlockia sp.]